MGTPYGAEGTEIVALYLYSPPPSRWPVLWLTLPLLYIITVDQAEVSFHQTAFKCALGTDSDEQLRRTMTSRSMY